MRIVDKILLHLDLNGIIKLPDKFFLGLAFKRIFGKRIDFNNPQTFNEKLQWLKLNDRKDIYTKMVDKYEAKKYVSDIIGDEYIIPTLGIYERFEDINFDDLPDRFVLKCTHNSGGVIICKDKKNFNKDNARKVINQNLKKNFYYNFREWPYKNIKPRIIIEKYMENDNEEQINDYKIFCFNNKPYMILVCSNRNGNYKNTDFYDCEWEKLPLTREKHENSKKMIEKPENLQEMLRIAKELSQDTCFLRVDLYEIKGKVYFGELTFFPSSGFEGFKPEEWDKKLGDMLMLPQ